MKLAIHQPQYLPWMPYLQKIERADAFVLLDSVDFQKNGLQNRNQIKTANGAQWLTVPVRQRLGQKIIEVEIDPGTGWRKKHWQTILQNYRKAAAFGVYGPELEAVYQREWTSLCELNIHLLELQLRWMGVTRPITRSSELACDGSASQLVLNICLRMGATRYLSGTGGRAYLDESAFRAAGVEIDYLPARLPSAYDQQFPKAGFLPDLAALDVFMNCGARFRDHLPDDREAA